MKSGSSSLPAPCSGVPKIPFLELNPNLMAPEECAEIYFEATAELCDISMPESQAVTAPVYARSWMLGNLVFLDASVPAHTTARRSKHLRRSDGDVVSLLCGPGLTTHMLLDDAPVQLDWHAFHLVDFSREQVEYCNDEEYSCVYLPYDAIGYDPSRHPGHIRIDFGSSAGYILRTAFASLHNRLPQVSEKEAGRLAAGFSGLLSGLALGGTSALDIDRLVGDARRLAMHRYVEEHLGDRTLGVDRLAKVFNVSRATVYRSFAEEGGVLEYIYRRRLDRAYSTLSGSPPARGLVTRVALSLGFLSVSHFTRRFRARFGESPGEVLGGGIGFLPRRPNGTGTEDVDGFRVVASWVRSLKG